MLVVRHEAGTGVSAKFTVAASQGHAVKVSGSKTVAPAVAGDIAIGVAVNDVLINEVATFRVKGDIIPMVADAAVVAGAKVVPGATAGRVKTFAAEGVETIIGIAWTAAAAAGDTFYVIKI